MQVEGGGATHSPANGCVTRERLVLQVGDSRPNGRVIPHTFPWGHPWGRKAYMAPEEGLAAYQLVGEVTAHQGTDG